MKIEEHEKAYKEHLNNIKRAIEESIEENQRNLGYNVSQGSVELFLIYLHKLNLLQGSGEQLDHRIFKSKSLTEKKIPLKFFDREKILELMSKIELKRNTLCYGKRKSLKELQEYIKNFQELRKIINKNLNTNKNDREK